MPMSRCLLLCLLLPQSVLGDDSCDAKLVNALAELDAVKQQLAALRAKEVSALAMVSQAGSAAGAALKDLLDQTDVDDQVIGVASDMVGRATSLSYTDLVNAVTSHELYKTHLAPHVAKVGEMAQPHVDPALKTAQTYFDQAKEACRPHYETAAQMASDLPNHAITMSEAVDRILAPVFAAFEKTTQKVGLHISLPASTVDKIIVVSLSVFLVWNILMLTLYLMKLTVKSGVTICGVPLWFTKKFISWAVFFLTIFYCCGLCRRKKTNAPASGKGKNGITKNGDANKQTAKAAAKKAAPKKQPEKGKK